MTSDTGSPFFVMELIFFLIGALAGALGCWLVMRARFFEPLRAEIERRAQRRGGRIESTGTGRTSGRVCRS